MCGEEVVLARASSGGAPRAASGIAVVGNVLECKSRAPARAAELEIGHVAHAPASQQALLATFPARAWVLQGWANRNFGARSQTSSAGLLERPCVCCEPLDKPRYLPVL